MEYEENDDQQGFFQRLKESPRTVSALIIILIVAAAIYAFSGEDQQGEAIEEPIAVGELESDTTLDATEDEPVTVEVVEEEVAVVEEAPLDDAQLEPAMTPAPVATMMPVDRRSLAEEVVELPEASQTEEGYVETAVAGDGMTHLARRAASRWLAENGTDYAVTNEHRIYIEDYVQKKMGSPRLGLGESQTITFELIQEAVTAAGQLNESQLENLSQYTFALT